MRETFFTVAPVATCTFCGEAEQIEVFEIWGHEFMLETCCELMHGQVTAGMADDPAWSKELLKRLGIEELTGNRLRRLADDGGCGMVLDWQLVGRPTTFAIAKSFIGRHHAHCRPPVIWRFGHSVFNGQTMVGVVTVGNPVSRALNGCGVLEVNRLCIRRDIPRALAWNAASLLYGWSAREAQRRGWSRIITYNRVDEDGGSLRAAGWVEEARVRGRGWHSSRRSRSNANGWIDKVRWGRALKPCRPVQAKAAKVAAALHQDCLHDALFSHCPGRPSWLSS